MIVTGFRRRLDPKLEFRALSIMTVKTDPLAAQASSQSGLSQEPADIPTLADIEIAAARLDGRVVRTPLIRAEKLSVLTGADLWLKLECLQYTGSFKERGALNKLLGLSDAARAAGVVAASAGNHAQGVAYNARKLGIAATIVMPTTTPDVKVRETRALGADIVLAGEDFDEAYEDRWINQP